jgi:hypothetical protein
MEDRVMPRTAAKVTQADIARVLRAAKAEGMTVEVRPDGAIRVVSEAVANPTEPTQYKGEIKL